MKLCLLVGMHSDAIFSLKSSTYTICTEPIYRTVCVPHVPHILTSDGVTGSSSNRLYWSFISARVNAVFLFSPIFLHVSLWCVGNHLSASNGVHFSAGALEGMRERMLFDPQFTVEGCLIPMSGWEGRTTCFNQGLGLDLLSRRDLEVFKLQKATFRRELLKPWFFLAVPACAFALRWTNVTPEEDPLGRLLLSSGVRVLSFWQIRHH